jgi:hypothetical protein
MIFLQSPDLSLNLLSSMITPAVLISACGTLVFSTTTRLARVVDRVRALSTVIEELSSGEIADFPEERRGEAERQLSIQARRTRLIQGAVTSFYVALGLFVAATVSIGLTALLGKAAWLPSIFGVIGTVTMFYGCMLLIAETRLALRSVNSEMEFILRLRDLYQARQKAASGESVTEAVPENPSPIKRWTQRLRNG